MIARAVKSLALAHGETGTEKKDIYLYLETLLTTEQLYMQLSSSLNAHLEKLIQQYSWQSLLTLLYKSKLQLLKLPYSIYHGKYTRIVPKIYVHMKNVR